MLPYDYGRRLFDAMITKYSRHYFDAVSYNMIGVFLRCFSNLYM